MIHGPWNSIVMIESSAAGRADGRFADAA